MAKRQLQRLALKVRHHYRVVFLGALVVLALALVSASRLRFDTDILNLLPRDAPEVQTLRHALEDFGSIDLLVIAIRVPAEVPIGAYEELADQLGGGLTGLESLAQVDYKLGELDELFAAFIPHSMLFLDGDGREQIEAKLQDPAVRQRVRELRRLVETPQSLAFKQLMIRDPLGLAEVFMDRFTGAKAGLSLDWASGYFLSKDHQMLLILAEPVAPPQNVDLVKAMMVEVEGVIDGALSKWPEIGSAGEPQPEVVLGGRYVIALGDDSLIRRDVTVNMVTSMFGVLVLFLFAFRRLGLLLYAFVPLAAGLILTFGFAALSLGTLSAATSGVAALLIGLGIDFVIVSYGRYVEERQAGQDLEGALAQMSGSSGRAVLVGAVTSAATFYAFGVTDFTGLFEMGLLTGTGILFCMIAVLLLLPAMLAWSEDRHRQRSRKVRLYLHGMGSSRLIRGSLKYPRAVLIAGILLTVLASILALKLEFQDSVQAMRPQGNPGVAVREEVAERFGLGFEQMMLLVNGSSMAAVLELASEAAVQADQLVKDGVLKGYDTVTSLIPPVQRQSQNLDWLAEGRQDRFDAQRIREVFAAQVVLEGMRLEPFEPGLELFQTAIERDQLLGLDDFQDTPQTARLLDRYLTTDGEMWKAVVYLFPPPKMWRRQAPPEALAMAARLGSGVELTGANVVSRFLRERVLKDAVVATVLGFLVVGCLLWLDFRSLRVTLLSLAPLVMGILWMLGGMAALGESMNFMNIFVSTMIIGIGVDYGIHMLHRYRELAREPPGVLEDGLVETGKAIVLAALSTTVGFGSLSFSHYPGLQSMGKVAILGAISTALVAITVLPAYLVLMRDGSED
jgi:predicted RND superfamily exporter protein